MPAYDRSHYSGSYQARAKVVRDAAYADPSTACWRCGRTLVQHKRGARWHAGHTVDGDSSAPLLAEADVCNTSAGARAGNRRRQVVQPVVPVRSREWY